MLFKKVSLLLCPWTHRCPCRNQHPCIHHHHNYHHHPPRRRFQFLGNSRHQLRLPFHNLTTSCSVRKLLPAVFEGQKGKFFFRRIPRNSCLTRARDGYTKCGNWPDVNRFRNRCFFFGTDWTRALRGTEETESEDDKNSELYSKLKKNNVNNSILVKVRWSKFNPGLNRTKRGIVDTSSSISYSSEEIGLFKTSNSIGVLLNSGENRTRHKDETQCENEMINKQ